MKTIKELIGLWRVLSSQHQCQSKVEKSDTLCQVSIILTLEFIDTGALSITLAMHI